MADPIPKYPLYDSTYTAYRLSPLYHGANILLEETTLRMHARRLRDILRGDILRGVDVGAGNADGGSGILESCTWDLIGDEASWEKLHQQDAEAQEDEQPGDLTDAPSLDPSEARGVHVELRYQKASYTALLLRDPEDESVPAPEGFTALPLLLVRMPATLRDSFTSYIASTFDARVAPMKLRSRFLSASLETILSHLDATASTSFSSASPLPSILSRLQLQLSFPTACPTAALRALDITLSRNDIPELLRRGTALLPTTNTNTNNNITGPFTAALSHYLRAHLALDLANPGVHISKIALPPLLALSADGRLKLFSPHTAAIAAPDSTAAISVAGLKRVVDAFYTALLRAARAAPVAEGVGGGGEETMVLAFRKGKGKEKETEKQKQPDKAATKRTAKPSSSSKKGKKRALGEGDANAVGGGGGGGGGRGRRKAEASPGKKRRRQQQQQPGRVGGDAREEEEEQVEDEEEEMVGGSSSQRQRTTAASSRGGSLSVPQEPPPPYELHDPAIVR